MWTDPAGAHDTASGSGAGGGGQAAIMPAGRLHTLTAPGPARRRSLALVVHESNRPWRLPSSDWSPRGRGKE